MNIFRKVKHTECIGQGQLGEGCPNFKNHEPLHFDQVCNYEDINDSTIFCGSETREVTEINKITIALLFLVIAIIGAIALVLSKFSFGLILPEINIEIPQPPIRDSPPNEESLETPLDIPEHISKLISQADRLASISVVLIEDPKNLSSYEEARNNLSRAVQILESIDFQNAPKAEIEIQKRLALYKELITSAEKKFSDEQIAQDFLEQVRVMQTELEELLESYQTGNSRRVSRNLSIRAEYEQALRSLDSFLNRYQDLPSILELENIKAEYIRTIGKTNNEISRIRNICGDYSDGIGETGTCIVPE